MTKLGRGAVIGHKYRLDELIAEGGYGRVWRATHVELDRTVAIKVIKPGTAAVSRARFDREVRVLGRLNHANIVTLLGSGHVGDGRSYLVTEFVKGRELRDWVEPGRSIHDVLDVARQLASALQYAHEQGVIHRDLKPSNVMLEETYELHVKVLDFGIARIVSDDGVTMTGEVFGTFGYMAPEQLRGERDVGPAADLYALGVMMFEMLEARPPFHAALAVGVAQMHLNEPPPPLSDDVPPELAAIVLRLLAKHPGDRYPNAATVIADLDRVPLDRTTKPHVAPVQQPTAAEARKPDARLAYAALAIGVIVAIFAVLGALTGSRDEAPSVDRIGKALTAQPARQPAGPQPPPPSPSREDAGSPMGDMSTTRVLDDCAHMEVWRPGTHSLDGFQSTMVVYVPLGYGLHRKHGSILLFHDSFQTPGKALGDLSTLLDVADEAGWIVVAPHDGHLSGTWERFRNLRAAAEDFERMGETFCLDPEQRFAVGYGEGGFAAEQMACRIDNLRAIATMSHRYGPGEEPCEPRRAVPNLMLAPSRDGLAPLVQIVEGKPDPAVKVENCIGEHEWSLDKHVGMTRGTNGCTSKRSAIVARDHGACFRYECKTDFVLCTLDGGRPWPGAPAHPLCGGEAADFPAAQVVGDFFRKHGGG